MFRVTYKEKENIERKKEEIDKYFEEIKNKVFELYSIAKEARLKNLDPTKEVEIKPAMNRIERIKVIVSTILRELEEAPIEEEIYKLEEKYGHNDWRVALKLGEKVSKGEFCDWNSVERAIDAGIRVGLAYITMGIVTAPIEGIVGVKLKNRLDGDKYLAVYGAGPIRAAGGTAAAFVGIIADYLRIKFNIKEYDPTPDEIERYLLEVEEYNKIKTLQYFPYKDELRVIVENLPIEISGLPGETTENKEVAGYRDLPRVETNKIREGMVLLLAEGIAQKSKKIVKKLKKWGEDFNLLHWVEFLEKAIEIRKKISEESLKSEDSDSNIKQESSIPKIPPDKKFLEKIVAGRPLLSEPLAKGGFRLRYGRSRTVGMSACSLHPASMYIVDEFIAVGTQLATERPGKAAIATPCSYIEPPIVKLKDGSVIRVDSIDLAKKIRNKIEKILFLGDILFPAGEFKQQGHFLTPSPWVEEWYALLLKKKLDKGEIDEKDRKIVEDIISFPWKEIDQETAISLSKKYKVPLHPRYVFFWHDVKKSDILLLIRSLEGFNLNKKGNLIIKYKKDVKKILEELCVEHSVEGNKIIIKYGLALLFTLNLLENEWEYVLKIAEEKINKAKDSLDFINLISPVKIPAKAPVYIGVRVGRPEKSKIRQLKGKPVVLFPVGKEGGNTRDLLNACRKYGYVEADIPIFICPKCKVKTLYTKCDVCNSETIQFRYCPSCKKVTKEEVCPKCKTRTKYFYRGRFNPEDYISIATKNIGVKRPEILKGVKGMSSRKKIPERLEKGILRAIYGLTVNKDGTIRFDATEGPITHFKPKEIGVSIEKLKELGYTHDIYGNPLERDDQILELKPQDIIIPDPDYLEDNNSAANVLVRVANYVDDLLEKFYKLPRYYNIKSKEDLVGHIVFVLAPHTSAAVAARIIGFTKAQVLFAHPVLHAAVRRNCDGDEASIMLGLEALLDFSKEFLPAKRGGYMDAPLALTVKIELNGVDDECHDLDIVPFYPLELYEKSWELADPSEVNIERLGDRVGKDNEWFDHWFTIDNGDINEAPLVSMYKRLNSMTQKIVKTVELARKIRAVDENRFVEVLVDGHLAKDVKGNLRKFGVQSFRCVKCNEIYRRFPLMGKCPKCGGNIVLTVSKGFVEKYLKFVVWLVRNFKVNDYLRQSVEIVYKRVEQLFGRTQAVNTLEFFLNNDKKN